MRPKKLSQQNHQRKRGARKQMPSIQARDWWIGGKSILGKMIEVAH